MTLQVLHEKQQISKARQELQNKNASLLDSSIRSLMRKIGLAGGVAVGDMVKSWDILATVTFLEKNVNKNAPILDIGCYASEIIVALHKLGYTNLTGADLNSDLGKMPYQESIKYVVTDFMKTPFADASFQAITSISVIEHGFDGTALLREMSRLLRPNGYFIASFDYWPDKLDTTGIKIFGMDWKIFSRQEVLDFVEQAAGYGLFPVGDLMTEGKEKVINCGGRQYTFGWLALKKAEQP